MIKNLEIFSHNRFYILDPYARYYCGLKGGYPQFSNDPNEARTLNNDNQFKMLQRGTSLKLEKFFVNS